MTTIFDLDTQRNQYFYDSGYSTTPSPLSSTSGMMSSPASHYSNNSSPSYNLNNLNIGQQDESMYATPMEIGRMSCPTIQGNSNGPRLEIVEQPVDKFRFRYKSEMHGTHGSLMGSRNEKSKKTYPTVELRNFRGRAVIRCSLYQTDTLHHLPHSHRLVVREGDVDKNDPHDVTVSEQEGYRAVFQGMGIIHTAKKHIVEELISKKKKEKKFEFGHLTTREEALIKMQAEKEAKAMNLNQVRLGFQAFQVHPDETWGKLCEPVFSTPINNMKSALTGELKISRLSAAVSSAAGGDDLFLLVEKVGKKNIKVRFFEVDDNDDEIWEDWGIFSEADVHHQYAIALRTPPYLNKDIDKHVDVFIQLVRPSDQDRSEPMPFKYKPRDYISCRKRARMSSSTCSSSEVPVTVLQGMGNTPQSISSEFGKQKVLEDFFKSSDMNEFLQQVQNNSDELEGLVNGEDLLDLAEIGIEMDGVADATRLKKRPIVASLPLSTIAATKPEYKYVEDFQRIVSVVRRCGPQNISLARDMLCQIFKEEDDDLLIHNAIRNSDSKILVKLLHLINKYQLSDVLNYGNDRKQTCLHIACLEDKPEYLRPLLNLGANPNLPDNKGKTPLHIAVEENLGMCASKIIDKSSYTMKSVKLEIDLANNDGLTALHIAVRNKNISMAQKLLEIGGASTKLPISKDGFNVLHIAVSQNDVKMVKYLLLNTSININEPNLAGFTPLELAQKMPDISKEIREVLSQGCSKTDSLDSSQSGSSRRTTDGSSSASESEDDEDRPLKIDENRNENSFDDIAIDELSQILNIKKNWQKVGNLLDLNSFFSIWESVDNPSKMMFNLLNLEPKTYPLKLITDTLEKLEMHDAVKCIAEMKKRHKA